MSTLHVTAYPVRTPAHPSFIDRMAMRIGLRLLRWGHAHARRTASPESHESRRLAAEVRLQHDRDVAYAAFTSRIL